MEWEVTGYTTSGMKHAGKISELGRKEMLQGLLTEFVEMIKVA